MTDLNMDLSWSDLIRPDLSNYCPASNLAFNEKIKHLLAQGEKVYHFGFGQAPFPVLPELVSKLREHAGENAYLPVAGTSELRNAICSFHQHYDGLNNISSDRIIVGPGTKELIYLLLAVFNGEVLLVSPSWTTYKPQTTLAGRKAHVVTTSLKDDWRITAESLEKCVVDNGLSGKNLVLILCNPDNPNLWTHYDGFSVVLKKYKIIVVSDEIYGRLHYEQRHESIAKHYPEGTVLSCGLSKWASAGGWRVGYHIYPEGLSALFAAVRSGASHTYSCAPAPMQFAVAKTLANFEVCDSYMKHTSRILKAVSQYCVKELSAHGVKVRQSDAGYYCFPDFDRFRDAFARRGIKTCEQMCAAMFEEAKVALMAGGPAFLRPLDEFTVRLCYVNFDGAATLTFSEKVGLDAPLPPDFVPRYCSPVHEGIQAIIAWCNKQNAAQSA